MKDLQILENFFQNEKIFGYFTKAKKAKVLDSLSIKDFCKDEIIAKQNQTANFGYFLVAGQVGDSLGNIYEENQFFAGINAIGLDAYQKDFVALTENVRVIAIPKDVIENLVRKQPRLISVFNGEKYFEKDNLYNPETQKEKTSKSELFGWVCAFCSPILVYLLLQKVGITKDSKIFLSALSSAVFMWSFRLIPEFLPSLFIIIISLCLEIAPTKIILSGLSSENFIMVMSIFAIALMIINSGMLFRVLLRLVYIFPRHFKWYNLMVFMVGTFLTPIIPSLLSRCQIMATFAKEACILMHIKDRTLERNAISISSFFGTTLLASVFLTSSLMNFLVLNFLPSQIQEQFQWIGWFKASMVFGGYLLVLYWIAFLIFFRKKIDVTISKEIIKTQLNILNKLQKREWGTILSIAFYIIGLLTYQIHHINPSWIAVMSFFIVIVNKLISREEFQKEVDWAFLMFLATASGIVSTMKYLQLDVFSTKLIVGYLGNFLSSNISFFIFTIITVMIVRLALPIPSTVVLICSIFIPLSSSYDVNPWLLSLVILVTADMWFLPYQNIFYQVFENYSKNSNGLQFDTSQILYFNIFITLARFLALYLSMPYWTKIGLL